MIKRKKRSKAEMPKRLPEIKLPDVTINHTEIRATTANELFHVKVDVIFFVFGLLTFPIALATGHSVTAILSAVLVGMIFYRRSK